MIRILYFNFILLAFQSFSIAQGSLKSPDELFPDISYYKVLDLRSPEEFAKGHIFNAQNISRSQYEDTSYAYGGMMPTQEQLENLLTDLGITFADQILVYDSKGGCEAARFWWIMDH